jgi:hypothetical protein
MDEDMWDTTLDLSRAGLMIYSTQIGPPRTGLSRGGAYAGQLVFATDTDERVRFRQ